MKNYFHLKTSASKSALTKLITVRENLSDADFYLQPSGDKRTVGKPVKVKETRHYIGIRVKRTDLLDSKYLYYMMEHLHASGEFAKYASGTTVQHLSVDDVKQILSKYLVGVLDEIETEEQMSNLGSQTRVVDLGKPKSRI